MTDHLTGPELFTAVGGKIHDAQQETTGSPHALSDLAHAQLMATQAQTAALVMFAGLYADAHGIRSREIEVWTEVIPAPPLVKCWGKEARRPECAERHTEDCAYAEPAPEPDSGLTKLLSRFERTWDCEVFRTGYHNGDTCTPDDQHSGWNCGYVWKFPLLTDKGAREIGLLTHETED